MLAELTTVYAALAGGLLATGVVVLVRAVRGVAPKPPVADRRDRAAELARFLRQRGGVALVVSFLVLLVSGWPVLAAGAGLLVMAWDGLFGGAAAERAGRQRIEALAAWTESLRDTIAGAVGLEQAIPASVRAAAPAIQPQLRTLVDRLRTRAPLGEALGRFADDLDDPSADLVVAALVLNSRLRGPGLRELLGALSQSARAEVEMRQRVAAERRSTRRSVQIVVGVTLSMVTGLVLFNREYVRPYDSVVGQFVLCFVLALFAAGFAWMRRLARFDLPQRFMTGQVLEARRRPGGPARVPAPSRAVLSPAPTPLRPAMRRTETGR